MLWNYGGSWNITVVENARYLGALAQAYYRSGKLAPAKARYEKIASTGLFRFEPDIWVKSFYWLDSRPAIFDSAPASLITFGHT